MSLTAHTLDLVNDHFQGLLLGRLRPRATPLRAVYDAKELVPCPGALKLGKLLIGINGCRSVTVTGSRIATILGVLPDQLGAGDFLFA